MTARACADLGGTWLRVSRGGGRPRRAPAPPEARLAETVRRLAGLRAGERLESLLIGSKGVWQASERRRLARLLRPAARRVRVVSDLELAHAEAFGGAPGILVVGGTGSAAYGRGPSGAEGRAGGLGPLLGDEGSAFWLGREALKSAGLSRRLPRGLALRLAHDPAPVRKTAALARRVLAWAAAGDRGAAALRRDAARRLAALAAGLARELGFRRGRAPLARRGGLFSDAGFTADFLRAARALALAPVDPRLARG